MTRARHVQVRLPVAVAARFDDLLEQLEISQARLFRALVLDRPLVASSHRKLWIRLARSASNMTQLKRQAGRLPTAAPGVAELERELAETRQALKDLRNDLIGFRP